MVITLRLLLSELVEEDSFYVYYQTIVCGYSVAHSLGREEGMWKGVNVKCFKC